MLERAYTWNRQGFEMNEIVERRNAKTKSGNLREEKANEQFDSLVDVHGFFLHAIEIPE